MWVKRRCGGGLIEDLLDPELKKPSETSSRKTFNTFSCTQRSLDNYD